MLIGTAIIEAGSNKFSDYDWGEDLVKSINSLLDKESRITIDNTGHELEAIINKMGKNARRAIEKYPIDETNKKSAFLIFKFFQIMGTRNSLVFVTAVILAIAGLLFGGIETNMYADGAGVTSDDSMFIKVMETFIKLIESVK